MNIDKKKLSYMVGGLLYSPAINSELADKIANKTFDCLTSMAFCLEDSIQDDALEHAEQEVKNTLITLKNKGIKKEDLPLLFVRVRNPEHLLHVNELIGEARDILTGYILPKFDPSNGSEYIENIIEINKNDLMEFSVMMNSVRFVK